VANTILLKRSSTTTNVPTAGELSQGELAINTADERLFSKNSSNVVFEITDHDNLTNYVANEHIDWTSTTASLSTSGTISGVNVTSGSDPGHTHTAYAASSHTHTFDSLTSKTSGTGNYQTTGDMIADNFEATGLGPNSTPGTDDLYIGGYGILGDRATAVYVSNVSGPVVLNHTGVHNTNTKLATTSTGVTVTGTMAATTVTGANVTSGSDPGHTHSAYLTGNQTITLSGDVTGSGATAITTTIAAGSVDIAMLSATGTPSSSTYLRGDNTWATIAGGGTVTSVAAGNGMSFTTITTTGSVTMGTPSTLTASTTNGVTATSHTHAITTTGTGTIVASTSPTFVTKSTHDTIFLNERASATTDVAGDGQLWVKSNAPNDLYFTTDNGLDYPVAYARYRVTADTTLDGANVSETLGVQHINGCWYSDNATAYTLTLQANTVTTFPVGAQMTIWNEGTGTLTITEGSLTTLYVLTGSAVTDAAGSATMAQGGYATLIRKSTTVYLLMGAGITP